MDPLEIGSHERLTDHSPLIGNGKARPRTWFDISPDQLRIIALFALVLITSCYVGANRLSHVLQFAGASHGYASTKAMGQLTDPTSLPRAFVDTASFMAGTEIRPAVMQEVAHRLERSAADTERWWYLLSLGNCTGWAAMLAEQGDFRFELHTLKDQFFQRQAVQSSFCASHHIKGAKLIWHFWDSKRAAVLAVFDVFTEHSPTEQYKVRWAQFAQYASNDADARITQFKLYAEAIEEQSMKPVVHSVVQANVARISGLGCGGLQSVAALTSSNDWKVQGLPLPPAAYDELSGNNFLAKCTSSAALDFSRFTLHHGSITEVFYSHADMHVMLFFTRSRRYNGARDIVEDPEALVVKLTSQPYPAVQSLYFFLVESVRRPARNLLDENV